MWRQAYVKCGKKTEKMVCGRQWFTDLAYNSHLNTFSSIIKVLSAHLHSFGWHFHVLVLFLSLLQVFSPYCQSTWGPGLCRQPSATSAVMRRASLCAGTMTAGASAPWTTHTVIAPRWISGLWKPVCWKSEIPGTWPTKTLKSLVSVSFLHSFNDCDPPTAHWRQIRPYY